MLTTVLPLLLKPLFGSIAPQTPSTASFAVTKCTSKQAGTLKVGESHICIITNTYAHGMRQVCLCFSLGGDDFATIISAVASRLKRHLSPHGTITADSFASRRKVGRSPGDCVPDLSEDTCSINRHSTEQKGSTEMTQTFDKLPVVAPANDVPGPKQGFWTYDDYAALPDDGRRYEIVNGVLYMSPSPSWSHQEIVGEIFSHLRTYLRTTGSGGAFMAPIDVELAPNVVFQPDVVVLLKANRKKLKERHIVGAPDLAVEIVSPSSETHDRHKKIDAYARAGVPEYWIVDPDARTVEVLAWEKGEYQSQGVYREKATLPSQIVPGLSVQVEQFFVSVWE